MCGEMPILSILVYFLAFLLLLLLVVGFHEYGHYLFARLAGVGVKRISVGMGYVLIKKKLTSGMELVFSLLPIGGYVSLIDQREGPVDDADLPYAFDRKAPWKRVMILAAGPVFSLILPICIYSVLYWQGVQVVKPVVGGVIAESIVAKAGVKPQDEILSVGAFKTPDWSLTLLSIVGHSHEAKPLRMVVKKASGKHQTLFLDLSEWQLKGLFPKPLTSLGLKRASPPVKGIIRLPIGPAIAEGVKQTGRYIVLNTLVLSKLIVGKLSFRALGGPISMFDAAGALLGQSVVLFFQFVALLSIAVGVVNLLPIPGLDGAQILFVLIEKIRGKPMSVAMEVLLFRFGMIALFIIFMHLLANDFNRLAMTMP